MDIYVALNITYTWLDPPEVGSEDQLSLGPEIRESESGTPQGVLALPTPPMDLLHPLYGLADSAAAPVK